MTDAPREASETAARSKLVIVEAFVAPHLHSDLCCVERFAPGAECGGSGIVISWGVMLHVPKSQKE